MRSGRGRPRRGARGAGLLLAALLLLPLAACSGRAGGPAPPPGSQLSRALAGTDSLDFAAAVGTLESLRRRCGPTPVGRRATLLLAAAHLDPRNPEARPGQAAELAAAYLREGGGAAWTRPVAEVLYLEALEKGAAAGDAGTDPGGVGAGGRPGSPAAAGAPEPAEGCDDAGSVPLAAASPLPSLPGSPLAHRLEELRGRVAELEAELERIRRTLEP